MKPQTEELLYYLLWSADTLMRPTWRRLEEPFEAWAWRNGLIRRLGLWQVGVPPSGPMDPVSLREANLAVGNPEGAPGLEITLAGPVEA